MFRLIEIDVVVDHPVIQELSKLALQFCGALLIAWLAVRWALSRFKSEKAWERRIGAMADVLSALREMLRVLAIWEDRELRGVDQNEEYEEKLRKRWQEAEAKFKAVSAIAILVLPREAADRIEMLERALADKNYDSWMEEIQGTEVAVRTAMTWLVDHSKEYRPA
ncbi:hypothetical protein IVA78_00915 [Bradyrhizobium sp. 137]|uniref:hypothetical protein n=1 Tax=Bradyrhizobium sp. 137 TaxID=2782614 RepID=UPI001FFC2409|nr:hypothetical protein [Bradyrhizobium sp. 137]MCK1753820.1 hypothetical protein [Bradyrhizobium sp. 137]